MLRVTFKSLWARKVRLLLVSSIVMLGVAFVSGSFVLTGTMNKSFDDLFSNVYRNTDVVVRAPAPGQTGGGTERPPVDAALVDRIKAVPGVKDVNGDIQSFALIIGKNGDPIAGNGAPRYGGNWYSDLELNPFRIATGSPPASNDQVVLDAASAKTGKLKAGDPVVVITPKGPSRYTVSGTAKFGGADSAGSASYVLFTTEEAQRVYDLQGRFSTIGAEAVDGVEQGELRDRVAGGLGPAVDVATGQQVAKESQEAIKEGLGFFQTALLIFAGISLFVGAFVIQNVFSILVAQRTKELALLRCLGARKRQVRTSVIMEAFVVGLVASVIGFGAGIVLVSVLLAIIAAIGLELPSLRLVVGADSIIASLVCGVLVTVVSALIPARRASRVPPLAAMRDVAVERDRISKTAFVFATLFALGAISLLCLGLIGQRDKAYVSVGLGIGLTFIVVAMFAPLFSKSATRLLGWPVAKLRGVNGKLARQNAMRSPRRTASTASALMIGVALVTLLTVVLASLKVSVSETVDRSFKGDFVVSGPSGGFQGGFGFDVESAVRSVPGVEAASPQRIVNMSLGNGSADVIAVDTRAFNRLYDLKVVSGDLASVGNAGIAMSDGAAEQRRLKIGDAVPVRFSGSGEQKELRLGAIYEDQTVGPYLVDVSSYTPTGVEQLDQAIYVGVRDGAKSADVERSLRQAVAAYPGAEVQDLEGLKGSITGFINIILNVLYGLLALAVIIALLGIATTLSLSVFERTHEIGLLRAVGMTRRQLRSVIRWEAVIVSLFGALLGMVLGLAFAQALIVSLADQGFTATVFPVGRLVAILLIAGVAGVVAAIWPARRAARMNVLRAIATQ